MAEGPATEGGGPWPRAGDRGGRPVAEGLRQGGEGKFQKVFYNAFNVFDFPRIGVSILMTVFWLFSKHDFV